MEQNKARRQHPKQLRPSKAYRWMECPYSEYLSRVFDEAELILPKDKEDDESNIQKYRLKKSRINGTLAHKVAEIILLKHFDNDAFVRIYGNRNDEDVKTVVHDAFMLEDEEMAEHFNKLSSKTYREMEYDAERFKKYVIRKYDKLIKENRKPIIKIEKTIDCSRYAIDCVGTPDVIILSDDELLVIDYKYGSNPVMADGNKQLMIYALGILDEYENYVRESVKNIKLAIYQPTDTSKPHYSLWQPESVEKLIEWGNGELLPAAKKALLSDSKAEGHAGDWCWSCHKQKCKYWLAKEITARGTKLYDLLRSVEDQKYILECIEPVMDYIKNNDKISIEEPAEIDVDLYDDLIKLFCSVPYSEGSTSYTGEKLIAVVQGETYIMKSITDVRAVVGAAISQNEPIQILFDNKKSIVIGCKELSKMISTVINNAVCGTDQTPLKFNIQEKEYVMLTLEDFKRIRKFVYEYNNAASGLSRIYEQDLRFYEVLKEINNRNPHKDDMNQHYSDYHPPKPKKRRKMRIKNNTETQTAIRRSANSILDD